MKTLNLSSGGTLCPRIARVGEDARDGVASESQIKFLQGIPFHTPDSGKLDCASLPFPDSKPTTWEFFTDDKLTSNFIPLLGACMQPVK
jgi:hypothetical protein